MTELNNQFRAEAMATRLALAQELMVEEQEPLNPTWAERGANGTIAQQAKEKARQYRLEIYGEELGASYNELVDPPRAPEKNWEVARERRQEVMAHALHMAIEGDDAMKRLQALRAVVDLAMEQHPHNHREFRMR